MPFRLATVLSSNPINFYQCAFLTLDYAILTMRNFCALTKLNRLLLTTMASRNGIHSPLKRENFGSRPLDICLTKCALENKLLNQNWWSWYIFSQKKLPHTLIPVIASKYCGKCAVPFFFFFFFGGGGGTLYRFQLPSKETCIDLNSFLFQIVWLYKVILIAYIYRHTANAI